MVALVPLTQGKSAIVDDADFPLVSGVRWRTSGNPHHLTGAARQQVMNGRKCVIYMHRLIAGAVAGQVVDHINGDVFDNRRANLRICTHAENLRNRKPHKRRGGLVLPKGVATVGAKYRAYICVNGKQRHLGTYVTAEEAARAYDVAARELHGVFARLNYPDHGGPLGSAAILGAGEAA